MSTMKRYLPRYLHGFGALLALLSGIPSVPTNPGFVFNIAVCVLLGYEALPRGKTAKYPSSSEYDALSSAYHGIAHSRNVKILFGVALLGMAIWMLLLGQTMAFYGTVLFAMGTWISVRGSEIVRRTITNVLDKQKL